MSWTAQKINLFFLKPHPTLWLGVLPMICRENGFILNPNPHPPGKGSFGEHRKGGKEEEGRRKRAGREEGVRKKGEEGMREGGRREGGGEG